jgi:ribosomal protein bL25 (Ctc-form)
MATAQGTALSVEQREAQGSRAARRLRRSGKVPGVVYGGGEDPIAFAVDSRLLRQTLAHAGAVIDLSFDGSGGTPVVLKELVRHPVTGETIHVDLLRVRLDQAIHTTVTVELTGADDSPGVKEGGVLEQVTREVNIEALPTDIPDAISPPSLRRGFRPRRRSRSRRRPSWSARARPPRRRNSRSSNRPKAGARAKARAASRRCASRAAAAPSTG